MKKVSAGLLMFRKKNSILEFLLVHPGGPLFKNKDDGFWTIPKGIVEDGEDPLKAAQREFEEETSIKVSPDATLIPLGTIEQTNNKTVWGWAFQGNADATKIKSNTFDVEWPPKSGKKITIPEIDRGEFFDYETAVKKINPDQIPFLDVINNL
ncbi:NUDIX domain-containing protein [Candidatus Parcubacteria bacterium]|nr:NUDIX domain-containing protein [Candidatus Parcubacteria bacterium]